MKASIISPNLRRLFSLVGAGITLAGASAKACFWFWILAVVAASGLVIYSVYQCATTAGLTEPAYDQEQVQYNDAIEQYGPVGGYITYLGVGGGREVVGWEIFFLTAPPLLVSDVATNEASIQNTATLGSGTGFVLRYGVTCDPRVGTNVTPWLALNATSPPVGNLGAVVPDPGTYPNTPSVVSFGGISGACAVTISGGGSALWIAQDTSGNLTSRSVGPQTVVILRATNSLFNDWQPIFTNTIGLNTVETFTDTNVVSPIGFYLLEFRQ